MSDLTPTAVTSASGASSSSGGGGGNSNTQTANADVLNLPPSLQSLDRSITLGARLVGANGDGSVVLRTAQGDVTLRIPANLQPGLQLQIQFQPGTPPTAVVILTSDSALQKAATAAVQNVINNLPLPETTTAPLNDLQKNAVLRALVLDLAQGNLATAPTQSSIGEIISKPGAVADLLEKIAAGGSGSQSAQAELITQLGAPGKIPHQVGSLSLSPRLLETVQKTIEFLQQQPGGVKGLSSSPNLLQALQAEVLGQAAPNASSTPNTATAQTTLQQTVAGGLRTALLPGSELNLKLIQIIPPGQSASPAAANVIVGQLTAQTVNGQPVVQTPQGQLLLQAANKLPPGTTLVFEIQEANTAQRTQNATGSETVKTNSVMPKLEQALNTLAQTDSEAFRFVMNALPKMNGQFPASTLFFMQAMQTGSIKNWLGEKNLQSIRKSGPTGARLVDELGEEFRAVGARTKSVQPGEWHQITVPYAGENGMATMRFAVRNHEQNIDPEEKHRRMLPDDAGRVTRFVFDIEFSELGQLQVDGLLRPGKDYHRQLDILLRTRELLPMQMRRELTEVFQESLGAYGIQGGLSFQAGYQNWIRLNQERNAGTRV